MDIQTRPDPVDRARGLGAEIAATADEIERTRRIPEPLLGRLHDSRLFRMLLPRSAGGDETEPAIYVAAIEELARHDASIAWNAFVANSSSLIAAYLEPAVNHAIFADPRSIVACGPPHASHTRGLDAAPRAWPALCLHHAGPLRDRGRRCGVWQRARDAVRVQHAGVPQGAAQPGPARRQRGRAGRRGARGGAAWLGTRLPDRDAHHDLRACRRRGA